jgi:hypothetical protein
VVEHFCCLNWHDLAPWLSGNGLRFDSQTNTLTLDFASSVAPTTASHLRRPQLG